MKEESTSNLVRRPAGSTLSPAEEQEQLSRLQALATKSDSEIDFSDIPEMTPEEFRSAVRGGFAPRQTHEFSLHLDRETASWLKENSLKQGHSINFALKQVVQHGKRALLERKQNSQRSIYDHSSEAFRSGMKLLLGLQEPTAAYVEVPEFSDTELKSLYPGPWPQLVPRQVELSVDEEVSSWLRQHGADYSFRVAFALRQLAHRKVAAQPMQPSLSKAS